MVTWGGWGHGVVLFIISYHYFIECFLEWDPLQHFQTNIVLLCKLGGKLATMCTIILLHI